MVNLSSIHTFQNSQVFICKKPIIISSIEKLKFLQNKLLALMIWVLASPQRLAVFSIIWLCVKEIGVHYFSTRIKKGGPLLLLYKNESNLMYYWINASNLFSCWSILYDRHTDFWKIGSGVGQLSVKSDSRYVIKQVRYVN